MEMVELFAGLAWDPEIRGFLAVLTGVVVLMGSVWLLLSSNSGPRLGTLLSLAGFFGWMFIMGVIWWIYGIGWSGDAPVWEEVEIVEGTEAEGHLTFAALDEANLLRSEALPRAYDLVVAAGNDAANSFGADWRTRGTEGLSNDEAARLVEVQVAYIEFGPVTVADLTDDQTAGMSAAEAEALAQSEQAKNESATLSELAAVAPNLFSQESAQLGGWQLLSTAEAGEAQASAIAMVLESGDFSFTGQGQFRVLDAFTIGGKEGLPENPSVFDRVWTKVRSTVQITHPTRYGIIQLRQVTEESITNLPGQAPKRPEVDPSEPMISVVMVRNLGNLRLLPALVTIGSLVIFLGLCYMLHERDKLVMARRAEFAGAS